MVAGKKADAKKALGLTTQRVDYETLSAIKTINYHLYKSKGVRMSQCELISYAMRYALSREAEFIEYVISERKKTNVSTFEPLMSATSKPWFPYGNLVEVD